MNWASDHPAIAAWICVVVFLAALAGIVAISAHQRRERKRLEVHHDGRMEAATPAPAVTLPASVTAPVWAPPLAVEPYAGLEQAGEVA